MYLSEQNYGTTKSLIDNCTLEMFHHCYKRIVVAFRKIWEALINTLSWHLKSMYLFEPAALRSVTAIYCFFHLTIIEIGALKSAVSGYWTSKRWISGSTSPTSKEPLSVCVCWLWQRTHAVLYNTSAAGVLTLSGTWKTYSVEWWKLHIFFPLLQRKTPEELNNWV